MLDYNITFFGLGIILCSVLITGPSTLSTRAGAGLRLFIKFSMLSFLPAGSKRFLIVLTYLFLMIAGLATDSVAIAAPCIPFASVEGGRSVPP